ncbi:MAG: helix-turn-helix transcriptional regulator [Bacilli bacterium]
MKFCEKLQMLRKEKGYSQEQLADLLEVSRQSVSKWESGSTYPEMDKLLSLCKIFNVSLDDLTNDDVSKTSINKTSKNTFSNLVYTILDMINKSVEMFKNMNKKEVVKCISELIILIIILLIFRIPFNYVNNLAHNVFINFDGLFLIVNSIWCFIINTIYLVLFITIFLFVYKERYLDKFDGSLKVSNEDEEEIVNEEKVIKKKIVKEHKTFIIFDVLGNIFNFFFKICLFFALILTVFLFILCVFLTAGFVLATISGISSIGLIIIFLSGSLVTGIFTNMEIMLLFSRELAIKKLLIVFISSLILFGSGLAVSFFEFTTYRFYDEVPSNIKETVEVYEYPMVDNFLLDENGFVEPKYVVNNELTKKVKVTISYYKDYAKFSLDQLDNTIEINYYEDGSIIYNAFNLVKDNLKDKKIYNYDILDNANLTIETSYDNIKKIKENNEKNKTLNKETNNYYNNLNLKNNELQGTINDLKLELNKKDSEISILNSKLENYKNRIESLIKE